jgi:hypothetical protein
MYYLLFPLVVSTWEPAVRVGVFPQPGDLVAARAVMAKARSPLARKARMVWTIPGYFPGQVKMLRRSRSRGRFWGVRWSVGYSTFKSSRPRVEDYRVKSLHWK